MPAVVSELQGRRRRRINNLPKFLWLVNQNVGEVPSIEFSFRFIYSCFVSRCTIVVFVPGFQCVATLSPSIKPFLFVGVLMNGFVIPRIVVIRDDMREWYKRLNKLN